jgi:tetratricopeptide (TPR) repeat protein
VRLILASVWCLLPANGQALQSSLERGLAEAGRGNCTIAIPDLRSALEKNPQSVPAINALAVCEAATGHPDRAAAEFERVTKLAPGAWQAWNNLGASYLSANQPERAVAALRQAVKLDPGAANAWFHLGSALNAIRRPEEAFDALDRAQRLAGTDAGVTKAWLDTAGALATEASDLIETKEFSRARALLLRVSRPLAASASWNNLLGYAEFKLGHPEPALRHLQRALSLDPDNEEYLLDLGEFLGYHRAPKNAVDLFEVASKRMPHSPRVQFGLAISYILVGRRDDAAGMLEALIRANPAMEPAYRALGECYEDAGNWDGLIRLGKQLQAANPSRAEGWYFEGAGRLKNELQDSAPDPEALPILLRAAGLDPESSRIHFALAKAYQQAGRYEPAIKELQETLRLEPQHERAHYVLAQLYQKQGKRDLARQELDAHSRIKATDRAAQYRALLITSRDPPENSAHSTR